MNARLEGYAREQLARGRGEWTIVHELVRMSHIPTEEARSIVHRAWARVQAGSHRRGIGAMLLGGLILALPVCLILSFTLGIGSFGYSSWGAPSATDVLKMIVTLPILFPLLVGSGLLLSGVSAFRHSRRAAPGTFAESLHGPARTGLWWRAEPFEWK